MKAFEKWLEGKAGIGWYTGTEEGWKAALEWVLKNINLTSLNYNKISKELKNE